MKLARLALLMTLFAALGAAQKDWTMYVGTYTKGTSKGIYAYKFQGADGKMTPLGLMAESSNPSFLALHPNQRFLYAVNEGPRGMVSAYSIDPATSQLKLLNSVLSRGEDPCHLAVDKTGKWLFVANYTSGTVSAYPIKNDGSLDQATTVFQHAGQKGPDKERQEGPHAHITAISPDNRFVLVCDLGLDEVLSYRIDATKGLVPNDPPFVKVDAGMGPRHLVFSENSGFVYVLGELTAKITVFSYNAAKGTMHPEQSISMLPDTYMGPKSGAEIALHPNGKFLYASNRGHDSIAIFHVDPAKGTLTAASHVSTEGKTPRNFVIDPSGKFLIAANQDSNNIVVFKIDQQTGALSPTGDKYETGSPVSLLFAPR